MTPSTAQIQLPVYAHRQRRQQHHDGTWSSWWVVEYQEPIGGERSVSTWLQRDQRYAAADAAKLTALYWTMRDLGACPPFQRFALDLVPARRQHDVRASTWLFLALASATWCRACRSAPDASSGARGGRGVCLWCARAPVGAWAREGWLCEDR